MKTLVIHPQDPTTTFLEGVYAGLDATVVRSGDGSVQNICELIEGHDRVIALGHGTPDGLLAVGQFAGQRYVIDEHQSRSLRGSVDNIYIWCNADQFVQRHNLLSVLYSGMFISEVGEALMMGLDDITPEDVSESNKFFASNINRNINKPDIHQLIAGRTAWTCERELNDVIGYNTNRLYAR
jgi:hypothetical protein